MPASSKQNGINCNGDNLNVNGATSSIPNVYRKYPQDVGILSMAMYFPSQYVDQTELETYNEVSAGKYTVGLGQTRMGFCSDREDIHSLCLTVTKELLEKTGVSPKDIGFLMVGTETLVDKSKSVKTVLMQLFEESGNFDIDGVDTTNACYGGTSALFNAINWVESSSWDGRYAIVVAGDIAIYSSGPARPTGGAGAIAMLIGPNAPLVVECNLKATHMANTYDFYKPVLDSEYPIVEGKMSIICYTQALDACFNLFSQKYERLILNNKRKLLFDDFDSLVFHSPYCKLVQKSVGRLFFNDFIRDSEPDFQGVYSGLESFKKLKLEDTYFDRNVETTFTKLSNDLYIKKTKPSLFLATEVGNMYTASLYSCLVSYILSKSLNEMADKRILMFSFGSGMAASMFSIRISKDYQPGSPLDKLYQSIKDVPNLISKRLKTSPKVFNDILKIREETHHLAPYNPVGSVDVLFPGTYYLTSIDNMYRRKYERTLLNNESTNTKLTTIKVHNHVNNNQAIKS